MKRHARVIRYDGYLYHRCTGRAVHDLTPEYLQTMQKNDLVRVFHATGIDSHDSTSGPQNMVFGIDGLGENRSKYHPNTPGGYSYQGLYVGPTMDDVRKFGRLIFEFAVKARNLHATDWSARIEKKWEESEGGRTWKGDDFAWLKQKCDKAYPQSFNPLLSGSLDPAAPTDNSCGNLIRGHEPQALFLGVAPTKDILAVHYIDQTYTPEQFIEKYRKDLGWGKRTEKDPKSTRLTLEDYAAIVQEHHGESLESLADSLFTYLALYDEAKVLGMLRQLAPLSGPSAARFWRLLQHKYCDKMQARWDEVREKRPDLELGTTPSCPQENIPRAARVLRYAGCLYRLAVAASFIAEVNAGKASWPGVEIEVRPNDYSDDVVELANIRVKDPSARGGGRGSNAMTWLVALADAHEVELRLHVEPFGKDAPPKSALKTFYRGFGFGDRKQNWMVRKPRTATAPDDYLYHVTYVNQLPSIGSVGLTPGTASSFEGGNEDRSTGRIFWTERPGVSFWMERKGDMAEHRSDNPIKDGLIPVVVRRDSKLFVEDELYEDTAGSKDSLHDAYYTEDPVPPHELEVWDGARWTPPSRVSPGALVGQAYDNADKEMLDGRELVYMDAEHFLP